MDHPTAFISYSHDSPEHAGRVLELANQPRARKPALGERVELADSPATADVKADRLAELVSGMRTLMVLDGEHRLISHVCSKGLVVQVDFYPLVREYFASRLRQEHHTARVEGHRRLYEHLCATTEYRPNTLEGLRPLYEAVAHGCRAGLHQRACEDVYRDRILRGTGGDGYYSSRKHGSKGADPGAVACFFERHWNRPSPNLSAPDQAWLLNEAAFHLRSPGRLTEAVEPMRAGGKMRLQQKDWKQAAIQVSNLSELEQALGKLSAAVTGAGQSVAFADRSGDAFLRMVMRTTHADALHQSGRPDEARRLFAEAETMQVEHQPEYPCLYSLRGSLFCDLLLAGAEHAAWQLAVDPGSDVPNLESLEAACDQVTERATESLRIVLNGSGTLFDIALNNLTLGRTTVYRTLLTAERGRQSLGFDASDAAIHVPQFSIDQLDAAVDGLRRAGEAIWLCRGLPIRAWQRQLTGDPSGAASDLDEAWEIAERGPMPLHQADILLTRARLFGLRNKEAGYPWGSPQADLAEARRLIDKHGYHRRDQELADAEAALAKRRIGSKCRLG